MSMMPEKRLVLIVSNFPQLSETFIVSKFLGLLARGWDVHIVCGHSNPKIWDMYPALLSSPGIKKRVHITWPHRPKWITVLLYPFALLRLLIKAPNKTMGYIKRGLKRFKWDTFRYLYLDAELITLNPDCVHIEFGSLAAKLTYIKELLDTKLCVSFRGYDLNIVELEDPAYYTEVWQNADACHFLGEDLWNRAQKRGCPVDMPRALIPPALDLSAFPTPHPKRPGRLGTADNPLRILSVGRLAWKKGYDFALQSVKMLIDEGVSCRYLIVGHGPFKHALYFACHDLGLLDVVKFCGSLTHAQVVEHIIWADVFLHAAVSEGFCNAVLEAQAMGVPVVCSDADGLPENVSNNETGFVVPRRSPRAMAEKLAILAKNEPLRLNMGLNGRQRVVQYFQLSQQLDAFEAFYTKLFNKPSP
jgi:colanic acid/amylovoran biosynthesis glycosyltransferase